MINVSSPITSLGLFARRLAKPLKTLGILTVRDLIFYFPYRYDDLSKVSNIRDITPAERVTIKGKIQFIKNFRSPVKKIMLTEALVADPSGSMRAIWFHQPYLVKVLRPGDEVYLSGNLDRDRIGSHFINPDYERVKDTTLHTARIVPIYSLTAHISEKQIRALTHSALYCAPQIIDWVPKQVLEQYNLASLDDALIYVHFPANETVLRRAKERLAFNELLLIQLGSAMLKAELSAARAKRAVFLEKETKQFVASLPFILTGAQKRAAWEILKDLGRAHPMNRLLNGDVGSGKTVVAAIAILNVALNRGQSAFLAPTEILALQHYTTLGRLLPSHGVRIGLLTANYSRYIDQNGSREMGKAEIKKLIKTGKIDLVLGTHALLEGAVYFHNLVFAIVDEQHRFGVHQRQLLRQKGSGLVPHFLSMTATPIPRTLALTVYGDLDISMLDEMPIGRKTITTKLVHDNERGAVYKFIGDEMKRGRQVFCICPLIDPSDIFGAASVKQTAEHLRHDVFPEQSIAMLHGKMKAKEKEQIMRDFVEKKFNLLVSTSVVEVGVDVPNATVMMIEGAERFGLAQLHQFRGRVGRGEHQSYCFLFSTSNSEASTRLKILETAHNGFVLAEADVKIRGIGDIFGTKQWGFNTSNFFDLSDIALIKMCRDIAKELVEKDKTLRTWPELKGRVEEFLKNAHPE